MVSPCFNEEQAVGEFYTALREVLDSLDDAESRVVLVDDGSTDDTLAKLEELAANDPRLAVVALSRNFGHQVAISAGLEAAEDSDAVVVMDSDLQHPPEVIHDLWKCYKQGYDVVSAVRKRTQGASLRKTLSSRGFYWLFNALSETQIDVGAADFYLLSSQAHQALLSLPERRRFLRGLVVWIGYKRTSVSYEAAARIAGESKYTLARMVRLALDALFSFTAVPVKLAARLGLWFSLLGFAYLAYVVGRFAFVGDLVPGWASTLSVVLILGGLQMLMIGVIGEYVARTYEETKGRPLYLVKKRHNADRGACESSED